jgi:hypothetical protein
MNRRHLLGLLAAGALAAAGPALALTMEERLIGQLRAQGFDRISVSRTLLGRTRIVAVAADQRREIIFNPRTGEILRDFWESLSGTGGDLLDLADDGQGRGRGRGRGRGGDDDRDDDKDDDDDNSGSGSD